jgi:alanine racemase
MYNYHKASPDSYRDVHSVQYSTILILNYTIQHIGSIIKASNAQFTDAVIEHLLIDSRKIIFPDASLFFALHSNRRNGHEFIKEVYERGVRNFVIDANFDATNFPQANFLKVENTLQALQRLAAFHRSQFNIPVIGITGSNGKTIVKEWLYQLLSADYNIVRSPRSYNSQIGVPLSVWQMNSQHTLAIFEAGISTVNEMENLQQVIQPTIGILTNIGNAHDEGFEDSIQKLKEKIKLFSTTEYVIARAIDVPKNTDFKKWGTSKENSFVIKSIQQQKSNTLVELNYENQTNNFSIPFIDTASVENFITCICVMLQLNYQAAIIQERIQQLQPVEMRMQLKKAINNCSVLNDSYSNDISSLSIALDYLKQQSGNNNTTVILSDILQSGLQDEVLYKQVAAELQQRNIHRFIAIGEQLHQHQHLFTEAVAQTVFYLSVEDFLLQTTTHHFKDEFILLKGARVFAFERISKWLEQKVHQTVMEINLSAMAHNLKAYQNYLQPSTKLMAMVKAFSYGSGTAEVARLLQFHKVDYLAVAYADEGVELRKADIGLPIMVMNTDEAGFDALIEYNLEPEIYSFRMYEAFHHYLQQQAITQFPVHIKLNTGMNRLGFDEPDVMSIASLLKQHNTMMVKSVFSHFTSSEAAEHDAFTLQQAESFQQSCTCIQNHLGYSFIKHIANTAGIFRHPNLQMDMVRLGIGLYGVDSANGKDIHLQTVASLKTTIAQIRTVKAGDTVGYNRKGIVTRDSKIATIRIGYADGFSRKMSNGVGSVYVNNQLAKVVGNVCMDMVMIDITDIENVNEGDIVEIFGSNLPVQQVAQWCGTISYEIMTSISQRVKRIYIEE